MHRLTGIAGCLEGSCTHACGSRSVVPYTLSRNTNFLPLERRPCEDAVRRPPSVTQDGGSESVGVLRTCTGMTKVCFHVYEGEAYLPSFLKLPYGPRGLLLLI